MRQVNLTNMVWVEQAVGINFSQGGPNITNEIELGLDFADFYNSFSMLLAHRTRESYQRRILLRHLRPIHRERTH